MLFDPETGKTEMVESDPLKKVDFGEAVFSEATDELAMTTYDDDHVRRYFKDKGFRGRFQMAGRASSRARKSAGLRPRWTSRLWLITASSDTEPGETYLFDRKTHKLTLQYKVREKLPRESLAEMKPIQLQVLRWSGDSGLPHAAQRHSGQEPAHNHVPARRTVGT